MAVGIGIENNCSSINSRKKNFPRHESLTYSAVLNSIGGSVVDLSIIVCEF